MKNYFSKIEIILWTSSVLLIVVSFCLFNRENYLTLLALEYASNDVVLIILWVMASVHDARYISVVVCFIAFLVNDIYGFISWQKMKIRQSENK